MNEKAKGARQAYQPLWRQEHPFKVHKFPWRGQAHKENPQRASSFKDGGDLL